MVVAQRVAGMLELHPATARAVGNEVGTDDAAPPMPARVACAYRASMDPFAGSPWSAPETVAGFARSQPNATLMRLAARERSRAAAKNLVDLGCGAGRNAVPLAGLGWRVLGIDLSLPMLCAASARAPAAADGRLGVVCGRMDELPCTSRCFDFVVAHGLWNLARSGSEFRRALREAARVAKPGAALFVFTFSRHTLPPDCQPVRNESFVFTQFSGAPQCFVPEEQLLAERGGAGVARAPPVPWTEHNLPRPGALAASRVPVIHEAAFRRHG